MGFLEATRGDSTCAARVFFFLRPTCPLVQRASQPAPSMPALPRSCYPLLVFSQLLFLSFLFGLPQTAALCRAGCLATGNGLRGCFFFAFLGCRHGQLAVDLARLRGFIFSISI